MARVAVSLLRSLSVARRADQRAGAVVRFGRLVSKDFYELPFNDRADLTPYLVHLTRAEGERNALENLKSILRTGKILGSSTKGFIKGKRRAACLMDVPFASLKHVCSKDNEAR